MCPDGAAGGGQGCVPPAEEREYWGGTGDSSKQPEYWCLSIRESGLRAGAGEPQVKNH